ncbi:hypothetical protein TNCV_2471091 [Trichonephila clavipes]|nr:hypothetical protein TNCV_2471091 [Trichonephila clavipes]
MAGNMTKLDEAEHLWEMERDACLHPISILYTWQESGRALIKERIFCFAKREGAYLQKHLPQTRLTSHSDVQEAGEDRIYGQGPDYYQGELSNLILRSDK